MPEKLRFIAQRMGRFHDFMATNTRPSLAKRISLFLWRRDSGVFVGFCALTVIMTWPWALNTRDAVTDTGDPYLVAWTMWWDYHQTFHDPAHLFQAPIFYPYQFTLAFSEHNYGSALPLFPLYALGLRPLTVYSLAMLLAFALCGYGAFRLTRALTGSTLAAWVAGIAFAFAPYRFSQLPHLPYVSAGWLALLFEATLLFMQTQSKCRAAWLSLVFVMNALTSLHWFVLSLVPLGLSGALWAWQYGGWRERNFWLYGGAAIGAGLLVLLPFFIPYLQVQQLYGMERGASETVFYSAQPSDWLEADARTQNWRRLVTENHPGERALFPGLLTPALALAALLLLGFKYRPRLTLDALLALALLLALLVAIKGRIWLGRMSVGRVTHPLFAAAALLAWRLFQQWRSQPQEPRNPHAVLLHGFLWTAFGFFGSFGLDFFLHRFLFNYIFIFRSIRVPARWAMIAVLGLCVLAGLGARELALRLGPRKVWLAPSLSGLLIIALLGFDLRAAPLALVTGDADPDAVSLYLKDLPVRGGVVHLPSGETPGSAFLNHAYTLRQADHQQPLVTAFSGFRPPLVAEIEELSRQSPVPDEFLGKLEEIPASYLVLHRDAMPPKMLDALEEWLARPNAKGRLRFLRSFPGQGDTVQIFAVTKNAPDVK